MQCSADGQHIWIHMRICPIEGFVPGRQYRRNANCYCIVGLPIMAMANSDDRQI